MIKTPAERKSGHAPQHDPPTVAGEDAVAPVVIPAPTNSETPAARRQWWWWVIIAVIGAALWYYRLTWMPWVSLGGADRKTKAEPRPIPVRTAIAVQRDLPLYIDSLIGTVAPQSIVTVRSRVDGQLMKLHFAEGQVVKEGQLLAEIDPRAFEASLQQARGQQARDEANLKLAKLTVARSRELFRTRSVAQQIIDEQEAQVLMYEAALKADAGLVENARLQVEYTRITAPISGRVGLNLVDPGNIIRANDPAGLVVITQLQPITVVFTIPQDEIPRVMKSHSDAHPLGVDAYNRDFGTKLAAGKLAAFDNQIDQASGTLRLKGLFENKDNSLFPNQFVIARLMVETRKDAIVIPSAGVQRGPNGIFSYVVKPDGESIEIRDIKVGPSEGGDTIIDSGLKAGEVVIIDGVDKLTDKSKVKIADAPKDSTKSEKKEGSARQGETSPGRKKGAGRQKAS